MKSITLLVATATVGLAGAQFVINSNGSITCTGSNPNANYCASNSLQSNIIIRCNNFVGQAGNCNDNLDGEFPQGISGSECWETSLVSGDANCEKNCVVYAEPSFTLPATECTPSATQSSSSVISTSASSSGTVSASVTPTSSIVGGTTTTITFTGTTTFCPSTGSFSGTTITDTYTSTTTYCPESVTFATSVYTPPVTSTSVVIPPPLSTGTGSGGYTAPPSNGTFTSTTPGGGAGASTSATNTPVGPTTSVSPSPSATVIPANTATTQKAGSALAVIGLVIAYFL